MGYLRPTAIIVTGTYDRNTFDEGLDGLAKALTHENYAEWAHRQVALILSKYEEGYDRPFISVLSPIVPGLANNTRSFMVAWDGSKEGWDVSDRMDEARKEIVDFLKKSGYDDKSSPLDWVEIQYGGDDAEVVVLNHADGD